MLKKSCKCIENLNEPSISENFSLHWKIKKKKHFLISDCKGCTQYRNRHRGPRRRHDLKLTWKLSLSRSSAGEKIIIIQRRDVDDDVCYIPNYYWKNKKKEGKSFNKTSRGVAGMFDAFFTDFKRPSRCSRPPRKRRRAYLVESAAVWRWNLDRWETPRVSDRSRKKSAVPTRTSRFENFFIYNFYEFNKLLAAINLPWMGLSFNY